MASDVAYSRAWILQTISGRATIEMLIALSVVDYEVPM
jgi:hypothetical protein